MSGALGRQSCGRTAATRWCILFVANGSGRPMGRPLGCEGKGIRGDGRGLSPGRVDVHRVFNSLRITMFLDRRNYSRPGASRVVGRRCAAPIRVSPLDLLGARGHYCLANATIHISRRSSTTCMAAKSPLASAASSALTPIHQLRFQRVTSASCEMRPVTFMP